MLDRLRLRRAQRGDRRAIDGVLRELLPMIRRTLYRMASCEAELDDLCQEALVQIATSLPSFRGDSELGSWAHRVAIRSAWKFLRARNNVIIFQPPGSLEVASDGPSRMAARTELARLETLLTKLPAEQRVVFVMRDVQGMTAAETSELLEIPSGTVHSRLRAARQKLGELWHPELGKERNNETGPQWHGGEV